MSKELARQSVPARRRYRFSSNRMTFPRELRDAIPDLPTYVGRVLEISAMDGEATNSVLFGPQVHLRFVVKETGKLAGEFAIRVDLQADAARTLAETIANLADQADGAA
jgi:hypothetical protein